MFIDIFQTQLNGSDSRQVEFYFQEVARQAEDILTLMGASEAGNMAGIYDVVVFFDAAYLSRSMPEAITKLFKASSRKFDSRACYTRADGMLHALRSNAPTAQGNKAFLAEAMNLLAVGDFGNFRTLIHQHPDYNQQDLRIKKIDEELHSLERFLLAADSGNDLNA